MNGSSSLSDPLPILLFVKEDTVHELCIVLATQEKLFGEALRAALAPYPELKVTAQVKDELAAAIVLRELLSQHGSATRIPVVIINSPVDASEDDPACMRLLLEFPEMFLYAVHTSCMKKYRLFIETEELSGSPEGLVEDLRSLTSKHGGPVQIVRTGSVD